MRNFMLKSLFLPLSITTFGLISSNAYSNSDFFKLDSNLELSSSISQIENLGLENKINKSLFLPELFLSGGIASEKLQENFYETEKGPFLFLGSKFNLYRGGRDSGLNNKNFLELSSKKIEFEIKKRELNISSFRIFSEINLITKEIKLIEGELDNNKSQQKMAKKKLDAGLTSSIDLIDFDMKNDSISNEVEILVLKRETLQREFLSLSGRSVETDEVETILNSISSSGIDITKVNYENSPKLLLLKKQIDLSSINQESVKGEYLPSIDVEAKWGHISPQEKFSNSPREHQAAVSITLPLFNGFSTDYKFQQSIIESTQIKRELNQLEKDLKSMNDLELKKVELSKKILTSLNHSLSQSIKYKDLTINEYKRGIKNSSDIISASDKKLELERKILETQSEILISQFTLTETFTPYTGE